MGMTGALAGVAMIGGMTAMIPPTFRGLQYWLNARKPNLIRDPATLISTKLRGELEPDVFHRLMKKQGFAELTADNMYKLTKRLLDGLELISLERRGVIKEYEVDERAALAGWTPETIDELYQLTEVIPSAGDIIRYAVREVYTPEIAEAFGQFDELEAVTKAAADDLKATGMTPDTFKKEWGAHWLLPAVIQGFEMLHRGVIPFKSTAAQPLSLERLMIALDIMPAWRGPLKDISYNPFTRVDVRRMHKAKVLDDLAVFIAYADVGFSPFFEHHEHKTVADAFVCPDCRSKSKAGQMLDFTIAFNDDPEKEREEKERDLTKADLIAGLRDGLLEESEVKTALSALRYDSTEIDYYIERANYVKAREEREYSIGALHTFYVKGIKTYEETVDKLGELNLPATMSDAYLKAWGDERVVRANKPTKSELMTFLRNGVITEDDWHTEMLGLSYDERYITLYKASEEATRREKEAAAKLREERDHTRADIVAGYVAGMFTDYDTKARLIAMGYSTTEAEFYIDLADYKMEKVESGKREGETT